MNGGGVSQEITGNYVNAYKAYMLGRCIAFHYLGQNAPLSLHLLVAEMGVHAKASRQAQGQLGTREYFIISTLYWQMYNAVAQTRTIFRFGPCLALLLNRIRT